MGSFPGKLIGVLLCFVLLIFAPIIIVVLTQNIRTERVTFNSLTYYVDVVRDKGLLTVNDYEELVYKLGSSMVDYEITISVQRKMIVPDGAGNFAVRYVTVGLWKSTNGGIQMEEVLDVGDSIQVVLKPLSRTQADNILSNVLGLHINRQPVSYSATSRNSGRNY